MQTLRRSPRPDCLWRAVVRGLLISAALFIMACDGNNSGDPNPPSLSGQQARVDGLVVLHHETPIGADDALGQPPATWGQEADMASFSQALAHADWLVQGTQSQRGSTGPDGRFTIDQLAAGTHTLQVTKTLHGNLVSAALPLTVGDQGTARVVIELKQGLSRTTSTYTLHTDRLQEFRGPNGQRLVTRNGRIHELSDGNRTLLDTNGDGSFEHCESAADLPDCVPGDITALLVQGASPVILGQPAWITALAQLSDDTYFDVTPFVTWKVANPTVARVNSWGEMTLLATGTTRITATLGTQVSDPWTLTVIQRPPLTQLYIENTGCFSILPLPALKALHGDIAVVQPVASPGDRMLWAPPCGQVVELGGTLQFVAIGVFGDPEDPSGVASYEDITHEVTWALTPANVGDMDAGQFTARQVGTAQLQATLGTVQSDPTTVQVVAEPSLSSLSVYPAYSGGIVFGGGGTGVVFPGREIADPSAPDIAPCPECEDYALPVLRGDTLTFAATAYYDTGQWREVTSEVQWQSSDAQVAAINAQGIMTARTAGRAVIDARLDGMTSNEVAVEVVNEATLIALWIYQEGEERVVGKGSDVSFRAHGSYDIGLDRDLTAEATWQSSDARLGSFDTPGVFTGRAAGTVDIWAEVDGVASDRLTIEVFETSELEYCDPDQINRGVWSDEFNRVLLESDCAEYTTPGIVTLRYSVTALQPRVGIFDPCLDLYVYQGDTRIRTIREEGCGEPFLPQAAMQTAAERLQYQLRAFWDLKTEQGTPVSPGTYTIYGRFYLYYDPVVQINLVVR